MVTITSKMTPLSDQNPVVVTIDVLKIRREQNEQYLLNKNVKAFLDTIAETEGGDYDLKYGGVKGKKNDKWRITDYTLPPSAGADGKTTASGRYQINLANWTENGKKKMGLNDFSPHTQDLIAIEGLRQCKAIDFIINGDIKNAIKMAARTWNSLPKGPGEANRVTSQHYVPYEAVVNKYIQHGGTVNKD